MTTTLGAITPDKQALLDALANTQKSLDVEVRRQEARADAVEVLDKTGKLPSQLKQDVDELVGALRWLTNIGYGVGKSGGHPESGEIEQALTEARALLSKYPKP